MLKLSPAKQITLSAMCIALTVLSLYAAAVLPTMRIACYFLSSVFVYILCAEQAYLLSSEIPRQVNKASGVDALRGNTRSHPEHDG